MTIRDGQQFTYSLTRRRRPASQPINTINIRLMQEATILNAFDAIMAGENMIISSFEDYWQHVVQHLNSVLLTPIIRMELWRE
jgi:hypothetical protein